MYLTLLGLVQVHWEEGTPPRFRSQRTMALLGYLVAEKRVVSRDYLATLFWPDEDLAAGKANLRRELHNLAQILPGCWQTSRLEVAFVPDEDVTVDIYQFLEFEKSEEWEAAAELIGGLFVEGITLPENLELETWLLGEQERWRQRFITVLKRQIDRHSQQRQYVEALAFTFQLLQITPWDEEAHQQAMFFLAKTGQHKAALKQFETCRQILDEELAVEPSTKTLTLVQRIQAAEVNRGPHLPAQTTAFVGREPDLDKLRSWLSNPDCRLVTLVGPGGIGKTRLAIVAAEQLHQHYLEGAFFVPLIAITSAEAVVSAIAEALNLGFQEGRPPREQLLDYLRPQEVLLVLDNLEQLLGEAGEIDDEQSTVRLIEEILTEAAQVKIIATSREVLNLNAEQILPVEGLPVPSDTEAAGIANQPAVELFHLRAQRAKGDAADFDEAELNAVADICRLTAGMPLAIELAAAQTRFFSPREMAESMSQNLDILQINVRGLSQRHQNIRAVFDVSWRSLKPEEQRIMAQLSVFSGGFTRHAAEEVVQAKTHYLFALMDKSLIGGNAGRFELHTLLRQFAAEKLAELPELGQQVQQRHFDYYRHLLEQTVSEWVNSYDPTTMDILRPEVENLRSGWNWILARGNWGEATAFLDNLWQFFNIRRRLPEAIELLNQTLQAGKAARPPADNIFQAHWERYLAEALYKLGDMSAATKHCRYALVLLGQPVPITRAKLITGILRQIFLQAWHRILPAKNVKRRSDIPFPLMEAVRSMELGGQIYYFTNETLLFFYSIIRGLNLAESGRPTSELARLYSTVGMLTGLFSLHTLATIYIHHAKEITQHLNDKEVQAWVCQMTGLYQFGAAHLDKAQDSLTQAANLFDRIGDRRRWEESYGLLAGVTYLQGEFKRAGQMWSKVYSTAQRGGDTQAEAYGLLGQLESILRLSQENYIDKLDNFLEEVQALFAEGLDTQGEIWAYGLLALVCLRQGEQEQARKAAAMGTRLIMQAPATGVYVFEGYASIAQVRLTEWEASNQQSSTQRKALRASARQACKGLNKFAQVFPIGRPRAWLWQGLYYWLEGKRHKALKAWQKSLEYAIELEMPYDEGIAHYEIARHLPLEDATRQTYLEQAITIFTELGTGYDLERAKDLR